MLGEQLLRAEADGAFGRGGAAECVDAGARFQMRREGARGRLLADGISSSPLDTVNGRREVTWPRSKDRESEVFDSGLWRNTRALLEGVGVSASGNGEGAGATRAMTSDSLALVPTASRS